MIIWKMKVKESTDPLQRQNGELLMGIELMLSSKWHEKTKEQCVKEYMDIVKWFLRTEMDREIL